MKEEIFFKHLLITFIVAVIAITLINLYFASVIYQYTETAIEICKPTSLLAQMG